MGLFDRFKKKEEPQPIEVKGHELICPICDNKLFWVRSYLLDNSFFIQSKLGSKRAQCFICSECTYIHWFYGE